MGLYEEAIAEYQKVIPLEYTQQASALLGYTYALSGEREKAVRVLEGLRQLSEQRYVSPYLEAIIHAGLGEHDQAFARLEKACQERAVWMVFLKVDPFLDRLRDDPRFLNLLRWVGLPPS
jgi:serine/threonine-protein kinase